MSQKKILVKAPVSGKCLSLESVPDPIFSQKMMGDGVAFEYTGDMIVSPIDGTVAVVAPTKHAIGLKGNGVEVLIHVGTDTVELNGDGFETFVKQGKEVKTGDQLIRINRQFMDKKNISLITPMVVTNSANINLDLLGLNSDVAAGETVIECYLDNQENSEGKQMKYKQLCNDIIANVGGKSNVISVTHCVTRLRFKLKDETKANTKSLNEMDGVIQVIQTGGQYQVVIGTHVEEVYKDLLNVGGFESQVPVDINEDENKEGGIFSRFLVLMSGIFQPILSVLMASGMIKALLKLIILTGWMSDKSGTYLILSALSDALFYFFPVAIGWSAAKKFGIKEIYGIALGACLTYPSIVALSSGEVLYTVFTGTIFEASVFTEFLGIPVILPGTGYASSVIPIILIVYFASRVYKLLDAKLPAMIRSFFVPFITLLITVPVGLIVIGPVAMALQGLLGLAINWVISINTGLAGLVIGSLWSILVMFGLHMPIIMMFNVNIATYGYDVINPLIFSGALASMGAVLGIIIRTKSIKEKNIAVPAFFSSFFGVNEPALYGVLIPRKKVLISCFLSAGIGSMIAGFCGAKLYAFGASGPLGLPCFINPNGIDMGFIGLCIGAVVSFVLALACSLYFGDKKDEKAIELHK